MRETNLLKVTHLPLNCPVNNCRGGIGYCSKSQSTCSCLAVKMETPPPPDKEKEDSERDEHKVKGSVSSLKKPSLRSSIFGTLHEYADNATTHGIR